MQAKQQNDDRKALEERWNREDKARKDEMEQLKKSNDIESQRRKAELERLEKQRQEDRATDQRRYADELALRKSEAKDARAEREKSRQEFSEMMARVNTPSPPQWSDDNYYDNGTTVNSPKSFWTVISIAILVSSCLLKNKV
jgi:hypothetical protein